MARVCDNGLHLPPKDSGVDQVDVKALNADMEPVVLELCRPCHEALRNRDWARLITLRDGSVPKPRKRPAAKKVAGRSEKGAAKRATPGPGMNPAAVPDLPSQSPVGVLVNE